MINPEWNEYDFSGYDTVFHVAGIAHSDTSNVSDEVIQKYYKINSIKTILDPNGLIEVARDLTEVESNGLETNNTIQTTHIINTLYDIDQVFGGS